MISLKIRRAPVSKHLLKKTLLRFYSTSVESVQKPSKENYDKELKQFETLTNISKRVRQKKPQRDPFVKNLLLGRFDTEILTFPQLDIVEVKNAETETKNLDTLLKQRHMVNVDTLSNKSFRQNLSDYRAIGLQASQFLDGRESSPMEVMRFLETFSEHRLRESLLHHEMLGVQTLVRFADDRLKKKYLHPVMKGEKLTAFCMTEPKMTDIVNMQTKGKLSKDQKYWTLNGKKSLVVNGISADYLVVFAISHEVKRDVMKEVYLSAFLVEKDTPGISCKKMQSDTEIAEIILEDVQVPAENIIGKVDRGEQIITSIVSDFRLSCGPPCITLTRNMLNKLYQSIVDESTDQLELYSTDAVMSKLGEIAMNLYAAESVTYLTAGLQDLYDNQDVAIESAIVKVLSSEAAYNSSTICLEFSGLEATLKDHWARRAHEDTLNYLTFYETNENQRMFIALMGLQYAGIHIHDEIKKLRNPLFYATYMLTRMWTQRGHDEDQPRLDYGLDGYLHPSLTRAAKQLEYCVKRLQFATERILTRYGLECVNKHVDLRRLADVMIDCYAMTAVLARASRAYCVGIQFSDYDLFLADAFCNLAKERVKHNVLSLYYSDYRQTERNHIAFTEQLIKSKKYFIEHSMRRFI